MDKPKILIIDDDLTSCLTLKKLVGNAGVVDLASNGEDGLAQFQTSLQNEMPHTLIFLDIMMPGISGHDVLDTIRASEQRHGIVPGEGAKVIMITSTDDESSMFESHVLGCEGYLVKPFSASQVKETLLELGFLIA